MSNHAVRRGNPNWQRDASGTGRGRGPKSKGQSFAEKVRAAISDEDLIAWAIDALRNGDVGWRERCQLWNFLVVRGHGAAPQKIDISVAVDTTPQLPHDWYSLDSAAKEAWLDSVTRHRLGSGDELEVDDLDDADDAEFSEVTSG